MARSPHSRSNVEAALKRAKIEGDWERLSSRSSRFEARNGAYFYFDEPDGIFFYGREEKARKALVRAIWSYTPPKPEPWTNKRFKKLERMLKQIKKSM